MLSADWRRVRWESFIDWSYVVTGGYSFIIGRDQTRRPSPFRYHISASASRRRRLSLKIPAAAAAAAVVFLVFFVSELNVSGDLTAVIYSTN